MAELTSMVMFHKTEISATVLETMKRTLTRMYRPYGQDTSREIKGYIEDDEVIYVPRQYGQHYIERRLSHMGVVLYDYRSCGSPLKTKTSKVEPRDYQEPVIAQIVDHLMSYGDLQMRAATGMGKTVMAIIAAIRLGVTTLIAVDQDNLYEQWVTDNLTNPKMFGIDPKRVGKAKGGVVDFKGKDFVVTTVQTLVFSDKVPDEFFEYFGLVIFDEAHTTAGAESYSKALCDINAKMRLTITATPRKDVFGKLLENHMGTVDVELLKDHKPSTVRILNSYGVYSWYANNSKMKGRILAEMVEDTKRNALIVEAIRRLYDTGRTILVLSDRVKHLQTLLTMAQWEGIPDEHLGLYVGHRLDPKIVKAAIEPRQISGLTSGLDYCPIEINFTKRKVKAAEIDHIKKTCRVIFATYNVFDKGVDLPRLSAGIDATPRAAAEQAHGRILRATGDDEKLLPVWVTIRDINNIRLEHLLVCRISEYVKSKGELNIWNLEKQTLTCVDPEELSQEVRQNQAKLRQLKVYKDETNNQVILPTGQRRPQPKQRGTSTTKTTLKRSLRLSEVSATPKLRRRRRVSP